MSSIGSPMSQMRRHFTNERFKCGDSVHRAIVDRLEVAALAAVTAENERGGQARLVVAETAKALGVDIDDGPGHRWDLEHMARVVERAKWVAESRDYWEAEETSTRRQAEALLAADDVDELKAVIVSQAREIARLKGESE